MTQEIKLTLEQSFKLQSLKNDVQKLNKEQAQEYLIEALRLNMVKDTLYKQLIKESW